MAVEYIESAESPDALGRCGHMRAILPALLIIATPTAAHAEPLMPAEFESAQIHVAQVERVFDVSPARGEVKVRLVLQHQGGSTDVSPHWHVFLALYRTGEMCDALIAYDLGATYLPVGKAKRLSKGRFRIRTIIDDLSADFLERTVVIDPSAAAIALEASACSDDFAEPIDVTVSSSRKVSAF